MGQCDSLFRQAARALCWYSARPKTLQENRHGLKEWTRHHQAARVENLTCKELGKSHPLQEIRIAYLTTNRLQRLIPFELLIHLDQLFLDTQNHRNNPCPTSA